MSSQFLFEAIGTKWKVTIFDSVSSLKEDTLRHSIVSRVKEFEETYSRFKPTSWLSILSKSAGTYTLPDDALPLLEMYKKMYEATEGAVTPLIGQVLVDAGYDSAYSFTQKKELEKPLSWDEVFELTPSSLTIKKPTQLDFGGLGKGYIVDIVGDLIQKSGVHTFSVDAGGDILHRSEGSVDGEGKSIRVGLEHPVDQSKAIGVVTLCNQSIAGSSGNRRKWGKFHHIINPNTLTSPQDILALWVVADSTLLADALTTALYFTPASVLAKEFDFDCLIVYKDFSVEKSGFSKTSLELF